MGGAARGPAPGRLIAPDLLRYHEGPGYGEAKRLRVGGLPSPGTAAALALALLGSAFVPRLAAARTWNISADGTGDAPTIQAGIDSAAVGDTVLVGPGTYYENILFRGRDIVLKGLAGPEATIIHGSPSVLPTGLRAAPIQLGVNPDGTPHYLSPEAFRGTVVTIENGETRNTVLEGFTITGGYNGVNINDASPIVRANIVTANSATAFGEVGAGISAASNPQNPLSPVIEDNIVSDNYVNGTGSGIVCSDIVATVRHNTVIGNWAEAGDGGGIYCAYCRVGSVVSDNLVQGNVAGDKGGGIYVGGYGRSDEFVTVERNLVIDNSSGGNKYVLVAGAGIALETGNALIAHNTIVRSLVTGSLGSVGGDIGITDPSNVTVENNIIAYTQSGGGIGCLNGATPVIRNNLLWQNGDGDATGDCTSWPGTDGNLSADPAFCDTTSGDWSVAENSPALTDPNGPMGAISEPGCQAASVKPTTWGRLKALYR